MRRIVLVAVLVASTFYSVNAVADNEVEDAYGNQGSQAVIGMDPNWFNTQWIGWKDSSGNCTWEQIGDSNGLYDNTNIYGLGGNDTITVLSSNMTWCGYALTPPIFGGYWMQLFGDAGHDKLVSLGTYDLWLWGGADDDFLESGRADAILAGDSGDDFISMDANSGSGVVLDGGDGNDCIHNDLSSYSYLTCGSGSDNYFGGGSVPGDCESTSCSCSPGPWLILC